MAGLIGRALREHHPGVELTVLSQSSIEILRNLEDFSIDVGLTYLDNEPIEGMRSEAIYMERYCPLVRADHPLALASSVSWADAAKEPLCLLTPDMQNRRIIDRAFRQAGCAPIPRLETNSVINLCANVHLMGLVSVIPEYFLEIMGPISDVRAVPLTDPLVEHSVGLVAVDRDPVSPLVLAAFDCARLPSRRRFPGSTGGPATLAAESARTRACYSRGSCVTHRDDAGSAGVQALDMRGAALEHGALIDVALVGNLAVIDGRRMFEYKQAPCGPSNCRSASAWSEASAA